MKLEIPGSGELDLKTLILDLNGSLTQYGKLVPGVKTGLKKLRTAGFNLILFSGDTRGNAQKLARQLGVQFTKAGTAQEKLKELKKLDPATCVAIGNGLIDKELIKKARLGIVVLQAEGVHVKTLLEADVIVPSLRDAFNLLLDKNVLIATLRK